MAKKLNKLQNLDAFEVSLVPRGKNLKQRFLIKKEEILKQTEIQTLIFPKGKFSESEARSFIKRNKDRFTAKKIDETGESFRFRQQAPDPKKFARFRTITLPSSGGVKAVVGIRKEFDDIQLELETEEDKMWEEILKEIQEMKIENEAELDAAIEKIVPEEISKDQDKLSAVKESVKAIKKIFKGVQKNLPEGSDAAMRDLEGLVGLKKAAVTKEDAIAIVFAKEDGAKEEVLKQLKEEGYNIEEPKKTETDKENKMDKASIAEIAKMFDEKLAPISKQLEDVKEENKSLATQLAEAKNKSQTSEFQEVAKELGFVGEQVDKMGEVLKQASSKMDEESFKTLKETLSASNAQSSNVFPIFKEFGGAGGAPSGVDQKIEAAKVEIKKENDKLSDVEAEALAYKENPQLYNEYLIEHPAQM